METTMTAIISELLNTSRDEHARLMTQEVQIGNVKIGGDNPVAIQSMTNTVTGDIHSTVDQIIDLARAGSELVRITVNDDEAAAAVPQIRNELVKKGYDTPLIGDFHYNGHILLEKYPQCAVALDKYRINPGNVGSGKSRDVNFEKIIRIAIQHGKPVRIGVNWGSLDKKMLQQAMEENTKLAVPRSSQQVMVAAVVSSAIYSAKLAEACGLPSNRIVLSTKMSHVTDMIAAYSLLAQHSNYAIHLGLTEAGIGNRGVVASTAALSALLLQGIGDTIRVSLTPRPGGSRTEEVEICQHVLQTINKRYFKPSVTSCPGCGRTSSVFFQELAQEMEGYFNQRLPEWKEKGIRGVENLNIAVMGCVVNGPGESKNANIGISLPGNGENPRSPVYIDGKLSTVLEGESMLDDFKKIVDEYVNLKFKPS